MHKEERKKSLEKYGQDDYEKPRLQKRGNISVLIGSGSLTEDPGGGGPP